jgi:hypothetical protein
MLAVTTGMLDRSKYEPEQLEIWKNEWACLAEDLPEIKVCCVKKEDWGVRLIVTADIEGKEQCNILDPVRVEDLSYTVISQLERLRTMFTCDHEWVHQYDRYDVAYSDGRGICQHCGLEKDQVLPIESLSIIKMSSGTPVVSQFDWGQKTFVQGGGEGVVLSRRNKNSYTTAFVEAFPSVGEFSTFIRGEGETVKEADVQCWEKYQRFLACPEHVWSREVHGTHRDDGYARCASCGLCASALEPETLCTECDEPTTLELDQGYICLKHHIEAPLSRHLTYEMNHEYRIKYKRDDKVNFDTFVMWTFSRALYAAFGHAYYAKNLSAIEQIMRHFIDIFQRHQLGVKTMIGTPEKFPEDGDVVLKECMDHVIAQTETIKQWIEKDVSIDSAFFLPKRYVKVKSKA